MQVSTRFYHRPMGMSENHCRDIVAQRSGGQCEAAIDHVCTRTASSMHHRRKAGRVWAPSNVLHLCGSGTTGCHGWIEAHPEAAHALGLWLWNHEDPATWSVKMRCEAVSILRAPYVAVLSLPRSKRIFWWAVASGNGDRMLEMRRDRVEVYQPMTGRDEMENVVYLKMSDAHELAERPYWAPHLVARD
jgi:hypothetical protein